MTQPVNGNYVRTEPILPQPETVVTVTAGPGIIVGSTITTAAPDPRCKNCGEIKEFERQWGCDHCAECSAIADDFTRAQELADFYTRCADRFFLQLSRRKESAKRKQKRALGLRVAGKKGNP